MQTVNRRIDCNGEPAGREGGGGGRGGGSVVDRIATSTFWYRTGVTSEVLFYRARLETSLGPADTSNCSGLARLTNLRSIDTRLESKDEVDDEKKRMQEKGSRLLVTRIAFSRADQFQVPRDSSKVIPLPFVLEERDGEFCARGTAKRKSRLKSKEKIRGKRYEAGKPSGGIRSRKCVSVEGTTNRRNWRIARGIFLLAGCV